MHAFSNICVTGFLGQIERKINRFAIYLLIVPKKRTGSRQRWGVNDTTFPPSTHIRISASGVSPPRSERNGIPTRFIPRVCVGLPPRGGHRPENCHTTVNILWSVFYLFILSSRAISRGIYFFNFFLDSDFRQNDNKKTIIHNSLFIIHNS